jgi:hypothetical protein
MPAGPKRVIPAAAVVLLALAWPAAAFANGGGSCHASACKVYTEPAGSAGGHQSKSGGNGATPKPLPIPSKTSRLLANAGKDRAVLSNLISNPAYGTKRGLQKSGLGSVASPSALDAAFDLGAGPIALLAILLASALGLAVHQGLRGRRRRRAVP